MLQIFDALAPSNITVMVSTHATGLVRCASGLTMLPSGTPLQLDLYGQGSSAEPATDIAELKSFRYMSLT